jgi:hypothetical protein
VTDSRTARLPTRTKARAVTIPSPSLRAADENPADDTMLYPATWPELDGPGPALPEAMRQDVDAAMSDTRRGARARMVEEGPIGLCQICDQLGRGALAAPREAG